jgi:hypothetical protein
VRDGDERVRPARPVLVHAELQQPGEPVRGENGEPHAHERPHVPADEREQRGEREPDRAVRAEPRQPDEDVVERRPAVPDDPPLRMPVPAAQEALP